MTPDIHDIARAMFGEPNRRLSTRNELRFGKHGSVSVALTGEKAGLWYDHEAQRGGMLADGGEAHQRPAKQRTADISIAESNSTNKFQRVMDRELLPATDDTRAAIYLRSRSITRWPDLSVYDWARGGIAYVARFPKSEPYAVQVVPLTPDGRKNPDFWPDQVTKRTYTRAHGWQKYAAVRLPGRGGVVLCEGVETGLSVWLASDKTVLCCIGLAGIKDLKCGKRVTIARDYADPGSPADVTTLKAIAERRALGQHVRVATPPAGKDFNDIHREFGLDAVADLIARAQQ